MGTRNAPPVTPAAFQVLLALASGQAHGYRIMGFISELTGGSVQIGPGTLYRTLGRLVADGLVEQAPGPEDPGDAPHDARRRYYRLTEQGWQVARREAALHARLAQAAADAGLLDGTGQWKDRSA
ncbi:PadR family transcriptional regulator [Haloechinothrix sp. LS1_15]|uniref:PadR family transcriptional regulator n=1 Tax=Haloechinothrix sp. LS1_15 TaxID=2652248 RepID=UPI0029472060|nr:PadR family transcriptional regulator [Haloechinothrix sp. LS1_15]MDV6011693.1 PadR family transcriptional regulator [Haloechinothrix sp. LS1_15]